MHSMKRCHVHCTFSWLSGGILCNQIRRELTKPYSDSHWTGRWIQNYFANNSSQWHPLAPYDLLKLLRCSCSSEIPCKTHIFGCNSASLICSVFCACQGDRRCFKEITRQTLPANDDGDNEYASLTWTQDTHNVHFFPSANTQWTVESVHQLCDTPLNWNAYVDSKCIYVSVYLTLWCKLTPGCWTQIVWRISNTNQTALRCSSLNLWLFVLFRSSKLSF